MPPSLHPPMYRTPPEPGGSPPARAPGRILPLVAAILLVTAGGIGAKDRSDRAARVHASSLVVDTHLDVPWKLDSAFADLAERGATPHFDIPRAREGGLGAAFFALYVPSGFAETGGATRKALELLDLVGRVVAAHPSDLVSARSEEEIRLARKRGRIAILTGLEGGHALEDSPAVLRHLYRLGVRYVTLTHTNTNGWADSSGSWFLPGARPEDSRVHGGLNDLGREMIREMNRLGMMIDVSHASDETVEDVLETSRAPVFASHSSCRALSPIPRNLSDAQIRALAARGGVVMINVSSVFLDAEVARLFAEARDARAPEALRIGRELAHDPAAREREIEKLFEGVPRRRTSWTRVVDHIEHVIRVAGEDAVGIGTDFDGIEDPPEGLEDVSRLPRITGELLRRGHSVRVVRKVLGGNFLRFFARVEGAAGSLPPTTPGDAAPGRATRPRRPRAGRRRG